MDEKNISDLSKSSNPGKSTLMQNVTRGQVTGCPVTRNIMNEIDNDGSPLKNEKIK